MPNIHAELVHLPGYKPPKGPGAFRTKSKPFMNRARNKAKSVLGNATSRRAENLDTGTKMGKPQPPPEFSAEDLLSGNTGPLEHSMKNRAAKQNAAILGFGTASVAGSHYGRKKYRQTHPVSKGARPWLITDVGTKAAARWPNKPTKTLIGAAALGGAVGVRSGMNDEKVKDIRRQRALKAAQTRKNKMTLTPVSKAGQDGPNKYSTGRAVTATVLGPYHGLAAAKPGKKARTAGKSLLASAGGGLAGSVAGGALGALTRRPLGAAVGSNLGALTGSYGGAYGAFRNSNKAGNFKKQPASAFGKSASVSAFGVDHAH